MLSSRRRCTTTRLRNLEENSKIIEVIGEKDETNINNGRVTYDLIFKDTKDLDILSMNLLNNEFYFLDEHNGESELINGIKNWQTVFNLGDSVCYKYRFVEYEV